MIYEGICAWIRESYNIFPKFDIDSTYFGKDAGNRPHLRLQIFSVAYAISYESFILDFFSESGKLFESFQFFLLFEIISLYQIYHLPYELDIMNEKIR